MAEYCNEDDVRKRLTTGGYAFFADLDQSGSVSSSEVADTITSAIQWAGNILDAEVQRMGCRPDVARGASNAWLRDRAIDIAAYRVSTTGGGGELVVFRTAYDDAISLIRRTTEIPQLRFQYPWPTAARSHRFPKAINVPRY